MTFLSLQAKTAASRAAQLVQSTGPVQPVVSTPLPLTLPQKRKASSLLIDRINGAYSREDARRAGVFCWPAPLPTPDARFLPDPLVLFHDALEAGGGPSQNRQALVPLSIQDIIARRNWETDGQMPSLQLPLGLVDKPEQQQQEPLVIDLHGANGALTGGPLLILGTPNSGKGTALQTLLLWLTARYHSTQLRCLALDPEYDLAAFRHLPHLSDDAGNSLWSDGATDEQIQSFANRCLALLTRRQELYPHLRWNEDTISHLWSRGIEMPLILLVISHYHRFAERPQAAALLKKLTLNAIEARAQGVYVVLTSAEVGLRYLPPDLTSRIGTRICLYLSDQQRFEYLGRSQPMDPIPGRGLLLTRDRAFHQIQLALPTPGISETARYETLKRAIQCCALS
jgi:hypothetical protein